MGKVRICEYISIDTDLLIGRLRVLYASPKVLLSKPTHLPRLTKLRVLSLDLASEGLSTQHPSLSSLFRQLGSSNSAFNLTSLTLSNLPRIDIPLLRLLANTFLNLTNLDLCCTERLEFSCCWVCFEDSLSCTAHSPIPEEYADFKDMAVSAIRDLATKLMLSCLDSMHFQVR